MKIINASHLAMLTTILCFSPFFVLSSQELNNKKEEKENYEFIKQKSDVLQNKINLMMQDTASWLDNLGEDNNSTKGGASASGYLQLGWMPRTADWSEFDPKFKVHLSLPRWNEKVALILDNDDEDELKLDYEASSIGSDHDTEKVNIAIQYVKQFGDIINVKYRAGISRDQLYARSEIKHRWLNDSNTITVVPRLDYFSRDGWAPSIKGSMIYPLTDSFLSLSASWQKIEKEEDSRQKIGFYHINNSGKTTELVSGLQYYNNENSEESLLVSIRHRRLIYKDWMFFELEPFIEFKQENDYKRELGLALRLIGYYGK
jgi:hypothetical protein